MYRDIWRMATPYPTLKGNGVYERQVRRIKTPGEETAMLLKFSADKTGRIFKPGGELQPTFFRPDGYETFSLEGKSVSVHRFVWRFFNGEIPKGMQIHHANHIRHFNDLNNLSLVTPSENVKMRRPWSKRKHRVFR